MPHIDNLTRFLAAYGALLASVGFGWNLYGDLRDRARLKVSAQVRRIGRGADGKYFAIAPDLPVENASEQLFVIMTAVNVGRRPVQWQGWGGTYRKPVNGKTGFTIIGRDLPKMLDEGESHAEFTALETDLRPANDNIKRLCLWDPSGRKWKLSWRQLTALKAEARAANQ
jgi:hypothetical protein